MYGYINRGVHSVRVRVKISVQIGVGFNKAKLCVRIDMFLCTVCIVMGRIRVGTLVLS